ncbi:MAG TPA: hypothetical protein VH969_10765 [Actinophytocola sp.]|uniref:hypothetical protein n=1 Tax=Actinophytocola sp. TaxID=1872138 RepID=UPI002F953A30
MASIRSLSSKWLAICLAAAYVLVSALLGGLLLVRPAVPSVAAPGPAPPTYVSDKGSGTSATRPPPRGFQRVTGPARIRTVIPVGWRLARAGAPGAMRASDPSDAGRFLGYGGAPSATSDIAQLHLATETQFAERAADYQRIALNQATYGGHPAIEWEYEHNDGSGLQHVCALYWLVDNTEYFVFASGPADQWSRMRPIYDAMVANSRP